MKKKKNLKPIALTRRDELILLSVYQNRFMRRDQIQRLYFPRASLPAVNMRLKKLYEHRFLDRLSKPVAIGSAQAVYALSGKGAVTVASILGIDISQVVWKRDHNRVEFLFLEHTLAVSEFKVNLDLALKANKDPKLAFYQREERSLQARVADPRGIKKYLVVAPDAFFGLQTAKGKSYFYLEVDLGTESLKRFSEKVMAYKEYWRSGRYTANTGFNHFRVLTVAESEKRLRNLIEATRMTGGKKMFLFTTFDQIKTAGPLSKIWLSPISQTPTSLL